MSLPVERICCSDS